MSRSIIVSKVNLGSHKDLLFEIPSLGISKLTDSYFFWLEYEALESTTTITESTVTKYILVYYTNFLNLLKSCCTNDCLYLPIDFSDQYVGFLEVSKKDNSKLILSYHVYRLLVSYPSHIAVDSLNPQNLIYKGEIKEVSYFDFISDFEASLVGFHRVDS